ncbi:hypothetical protein CWI38_0774p0010 [Hamiltosporidium tvaerminnensis]|uniref:Uncharacterized protein n=1 Tax=Hamiltosporidium tvaerminnensis TaxID=1176355 RepID=A0A4V2JXM4_9MICR|nr:hypothetical protein CWI38_0774p0010 [Hamiltosporidium tvaerminnensis]
MGMFNQEPRKPTLLFVILFILVCCLKPIQNNSLDTQEIIHLAKEKRTEIENLIHFEIEIRPEEIIYEEIDTYLEYETKLLECINSNAFESYSKNLNEKSLEYMYESLDFIIGNRKIFLLRNNTATEKYNEAMTKIKAELELLVSYISYFLSSNICNCTRSHFKIINEIQHLINYLKLIYLRIHDSMKKVLDCETKYKKLLENHHFLLFISSRKVHNDKIREFKAKIEKIRVNYDDIKDEAARAIITYRNYNFEEIIIMQYSQNNFYALFITNEIFSNIYSYIEIYEDKNLTNKTIFKEEVVKFYGLLGYVRIYISTYKIFRSNFVELLDKTTKCKKYISNIYARIEKSTNSLQEYAEIYEIDEFKDRFKGFLYTTKQELADKISEIMNFEKEQLAKIQKIIDYNNLILKTYNNLKKNHRLINIQKKISVLEVFQQEHTDFVHRMQKNLNDILSYALEHGND